MSALSDRYTDPNIVWGDFFGLHAACAARGWSLTLCAPPRGAPCYYEVSREGGPALRFTTRDAVCDWVDEGAQELLPLFRRAA